MASSSLCFLLFFFLFAGIVSAQLSSTFYDTSCPDALSTIKNAVKTAIASEPRMGASLLRLHFHDCFVQGYDGSVLLDDNPPFFGEKMARPNKNSVRGFKVIDLIKSQIEAICERTVSCADILAIAARDSVVALGGPSWTVQLGRRDSTLTNYSSANRDIPAPSANLRGLISNFRSKGLNISLVSLVATMEQVLRSISETLFTLASTSLPSGSQEPLFDIPDTPSTSAQSLESAIVLPIVMPLLPLRSTISPTLLSDATSFWSRLTSY